MYQGFQSGFKCTCLEESGTPDAEMTVTVHSTDRAGQTISREITLYRELPPGEILIYPNPGREESNILVQLSGPGKVEIRIFDATGRLVYEEKEQQEGSFVRNLNLRGLSSGMYQVIVQVRQRGDDGQTGQRITVYNSKNDFKGLLKNPEGLET
jgi:hypothetical protein